MIMGQPGADEMKQVKINNLSSLRAANKDIFIWGAGIVAIIFAYTSIIHTSKGRRRYSR